MGYKSPPAPSSQVLTLAEKQKLNAVLDIRSVSAPLSLVGTDLQVAGGSGTGDVVGPASAVNNRVAFFDGTTGKLIKDSGLTLSGNNTGDQVPNVGATTVDFGAFPGASDTSVVITGQSGILIGSKVSAWIVATATSDHTADEHWVETIQVTAGNIVAGTGFTIYARNTNQINEPGPFIQDRLSQTAALAKGGPGKSPETLNAQPKGTRLYGAFTVHWQWI